MRNNTVPFVLLALLFLLPLCSQAKAAAAVDSRVGMVWYRIHLGLGEDARRVGDRELAGFIDAEISSRFPAGLTVIQANGQWRSPDTGAILREKTVVVDIQGVDNRETAANVEEIGKAYVDRFASANASAFIVRVGKISASLYYVGPERQGSE